MDGGNRYRDSMPGIERRSTNKQSTIEDLHGRLCLVENKMEDMHEVVDGLKPITEFIDDLRATARLGRKTSNVIKKIAKTSISVGGVFILIYSYMVGGFSFVKELIKKVI